MKNLKTKLVALPVLALASVNTFAADAAVDTAVATATAAGTSSVSAVTVGIIAVVAVVTGVSLIMSWLKKV
jgi:hypothetical protein